MQHDAYRVADFAGFSWLSVSILVYAMFSWLYSENFCQIKIPIVYSSFFGKFGDEIGCCTSGGYGRSSKIPRQRCHKLSFAPVKLTAFLRSRAKKKVQMMEDWLSVS